ncbi:MAG TPA: nucleotidyl transferase AbiEii/AbiGii toxin family protein [Gammaproteobacteria bacterium]|jgi:predicted nucleotidyltransferase component of viral defense system|nr:nucleotidyl transferase AbiEii/AbiGii toxin family protein [Gammaproteobacteria bacterium]
MILKEEIQKIATAKKLGMDIVEKDYVLSWVLAGIHHHAATKNSWIFKGGTCLKKCYFETYRFSEDLDFTYYGKQHDVSEGFYKNIFIEISRWVYSNAGIEFPQEGIEFDIFKNTRDSISVQGKLSYRGPIQRNISVTRLPRLKIDLTLDEPLILGSEIKNIYHAYSDMLEGGKKILAYSYEELFSEKLRSLMQRLRPRDLYDVIHLYRKKDSNVNFNLLKQTLRKKCELRSAPFPKMRLIEAHDNRKFLESEWAVQLRHQVSKLPAFHLFLNELEEVLHWISNEEEN